MSRRGLSPSQIDRVVAVLQRRLSRVHDGNKSALAREVGVAQSSLWDVINRTNPPSRATIEAIARIEGISVESLLTSARERAAGIARESGIPEAAIVAALADQGDENADGRTVLEWIDRIRAFQEISARGTRGAA